jgi:hypothetical protein
VSLSRQNNSKVLKNSKVKSDIFVKLSRSFCFLFTSDMKDEVITDYELFQAWVNCVTNSRPLCQIERNNDDISEILGDIVMSCDSYIVLLIGPYLLIFYE